VATADRPSLMLFVVAEEVQLNWRCQAARVGAPSRGIGGREERSPCRAATAPTESLTNFLISLYAVIGYLPTLTLIGARSLQPFT
jgi:hypothetical protein